MVTATALIVAASLAAGGSVGLLVAAVAWRRRDHPAADPLVKMSLFPSLSGFLYAAIVLVADPGIAVGLRAVANATLLLSPPYFLLFAITYTGHERWLSGRRRSALLAFYAVGVALAAAEPFVWSTVEMRTVSGLTLPVVADATYRLALAVVFAYPAIAVGFGLLASFLVSPRNMYRTQTAVILAGVSVSIVGNLVFEAGLSLHPGLNLTALVFAVEAAIIALALFDYEFLNVEPLAPDVVLEEISDPVVVLDGSDCLVDANPVARALFPESDPIGTPIEDLLPGLSAAIEHDRAYVQAEAGRSVTDGGEASIYDVNDAPIEDQYGRDRGTVVVLRDVTLQKRRERTLESLQSVTRQFLAAETSEEVLDIAVTTAHDLLECPYSGAMLYDEAADVLRPKAFAEPLAAAYRDSDADIDPVVEPGDSDVWQVFETGEARLGTPIESDDSLPVDIGRSLLYPLGDHGIIGFSAGPNRDAFTEDDRRFANILARTTENALDRIQKESQLRESRELVAQRNEQIEFFNGVLRHDLLNGMLVIQAHTEQLAEHVDGEAADHLETITEWSEDISTLARKVRSVSNAVTNEDPVELEPVDLAGPLREKAQKIRDTYESAAVELDLSDSDLPPVLADDLLPAVVENLLVNAVEHNDTDHPEVHVEASASGDTVRLRITDNGPGVDPALREDVFQKGVTDEKSGSIGFGLYFVGVMVDRYGGDVRFEANEPRGAVAVLELSVAERD